MSPYIKIPEPLLERLKYADKKNVQIIVVCRKDDLKPDARSDLKQLKNLELRFDKNLHAKCFYNEESMVITSLNLHEHSQQHNREMGILISLKDDRDIFNEARNEAEFIVNRAEKDSLIRGVLSEVVKEAKTIVDSAIKDEPKRPKSRSYSYKPRTKQKGYCIRCGIVIPYDLEKPLCPDCFSKWNIFGNPDYPERFCHTCSKPAHTITIEKPICGSCYWSQK
ncbi:phospholipase D-like domain-containing protein [Chloroflexota bacterium]